MFERIKKSSYKGFNFIEMSIVVSIIGILCAISYPMGVNYIKKSRDGALKKDLYVMRECIDKYYAVNSKYPEKLEELVEKKFLRSIPSDPVTGQRNWKIVHSKNGADDVYDVKSAASGTDFEGKLYSNY